MESTHRLEDERCIVVDRVLPAPLLEQEDDHRNEEPNPVALAQERLLEAQICPRNALFVDGSLNLGELVSDAMVVWVHLAEICKVPDRLIVAVFRRKPTRRLLDREKTKRHDPGWNKLQTKWDPPDAEA